MCYALFSIFTKYASKSDISKGIEFFLERNTIEIKAKYDGNTVEINRALRGGQARSVK
jgi:hypothetical protein